ncbi:unnamed protein product, partial [Musa hybrid cultivar]
MFHLLCWLPSYGLGTSPSYTKVAPLLSSTTSHCEKHLSTYSFMHSLKRNKMTPQHAKVLVFIRRNLYLLFSPRELQNTKVRLRCRILLETFDSFEDVGDLEIINLSLDEPSWK